MLYDDIKDLAGERLASFCKDYTTLYAEVTPLNIHRRQKRGTVFDSSFIKRTPSCIILANKKTKLKLTIYINQKERKKERKVKYKFE